MFGRVVDARRYEPAHLDLNDRNSARTMMIELAGSGNSVLEIGTSTGYMSRVLKERGNSVVGVEIDPQAASIAQQYCDRLLNADIESLLNSCALEKNSFDVVIVGDVLEHLKWPNKVIEDLRAYLKPQGYLVVSLPNVAHGDVILNLLAGKFPYHESGLLDITHLRFFGLDDIVKLFASAGYEICDLQRAKVDVGCTETSLDMSAVPPELLRGIRSLPQADTYQFVFKAFRAGECPKPLAVQEVTLSQSFEPFTAELRQLRAYLARLQPEFQEKAEWANKLNAELATARAQIHDLNSVVTRETRWKRVLAGLVSAPVFWFAGLLLILIEIVARSLRSVLRRPAPVASPFDPTHCSVVIVSWEGKDLLAESLPALLKAISFQGGGHEVIVVDNGSTDGTEEYVRTNFPQVRLVRNPTNDYFAGGNNLGVGHARNDILILLNNDMIVHEDFLEPLLAGFRAPDIFAVASQVFLADPSKRREETGKARVSFNGCDLDWRHETILPSDEHQQYVPVLWGHGGAVAVDRAKYLWLGGFDRLYDPFYVEDADLSYAAWKIGWRCELAVHSKVIHKHRSSTSRFGTQFITQTVRRNQYLFFWKNFSDLGKLLAHFGRSPRALIRRAGMSGIGARLELRALLGAAKRLPGVVQHKLHLARSTVRTDQQILEITNTPPEEAIRSDQIDFAVGPFSDQLGEGWHDREVGGGKAFRWMANRASAFLLAPKHEAELVLKGYVPPPSSYGESGLHLAVACNGEQKRFPMSEGEFECRWPVRGIPAGLPLEIELSVNHTMKSNGDQRTLGVVIHSIGFSASRHQSREIPRPSSVSIDGDQLHRAENAGQRRVLMVCAYLPCVGTHGGGNMMFNLIRHLSKSHRLTVLSFYEQKAELDKLPELARYCEKVEALYRGQTFDVSNLFGLKPPEIVHEFYHRRMERLVTHYLTTQKFDLLQCEYLQTAHFAKAEASIPAVLTNHEVQSLARANRYKALPWNTLAKPKALLSAMRMLNYEQQMLERFSAVVVLTQAERGFLSRYAAKPTVYCHPMGVDCDFFSPGEEAPNSMSVVFVGNFRHSPNASGALWLVEKVWPRLLERYPQAHLELVGNNPTVKMRELHGQNNVAITGWVDDVRPYLQRASVVVAPVFEGAGMRTKVLEAWAMAKPVVGTPLAFEGLAAEDAGFSFMASDADSFVRRIDELFQNQALAAAMGTRARHLALSSFSWEAFAAFYSSIYDQILSSAVHGLPQPGISEMQVANFQNAEKMGRH